MSVIVMSKSRQDEKVSFTLLFGPIVALRGESSGLFEGAFCGDDEVDDITLCSDLSKR